jgi:hypothetical protein
MLYQNITNTGGVGRWRDLNHRLRSGKPPACFIAIEGNEINRTIDVVEFDFIAGFEAVVFSYVSGYCEAVI